MRASPLLTLALAVACSACGTIEVRKTTNALEYLYPEGTEEVPPQDVAINLPVRVGVAFAPGGSGSKAGVGTGYWQREIHEPLSEYEKEQLLERVARDLREHDFVGGVEVIPGLYLQPGGGFADLDKLKTMFGLDVMVLLSYDQLQFSESNGWSVTYLTIVGAWVADGEDNQTQTFVDAVVYDIRSRALLFRTAGTASTGESATAIGTAASLRSQSREGFDVATDQLVANLQTALSGFGDAALTGHVRGSGTPAIEITASHEYSGAVSFEGGHYRGALGLPELALLGLLLLAFTLERRHLAGKRGKRGEGGEWGERGERGEPIEQAA